MAARAAVVKGTFLRPATSLNRRKYTAGNISSAVARMQSRIASEGSLPISMATGHGAANEDDALATIGRVTKVDLDANGVATFEADIADTARGRDIAALVTPDQPYIKGVSIRGAWASQPYTITDEDGQESTTADDLEIKGIDFTWKPGVAGAEITSAQAIAEALHDPDLIFESVEDAEMFVDEASTTESTPSKWGDPGWLKDNVKRFPLNTPTEVREAWAAIHATDIWENQYSSNQLQRLKSKIKSAAKRHDFDIVAESQGLIDEVREVLEAYASVSWDNGQASLGVSGYTDDPTFLGPIVQRLAYGAMTALAAIDPDIDGDIDTQGASGPATTAIAVPGEEDPTTEGAYGEPGSPTDAVTPIECTCGEAIDDTAMYCSQCGAPVAQAESTDSPNIENEESQMATPTPVAPEAAVAPVAETAAPAVAEAAPVTEGVADEIAPARNLTDGDVTAIGNVLAAALASVLTPAAVSAVPVEAAPAAAAPVAEAAPVATAAVPVVEAAPVAAAPAEAPVVEAEALVAEADKTFTATEVAEMLKQKELEATEAANLAAVEAFRAGPGARKGLVDTTTQPLTGLAEGDELSAEFLAKLSSTDLMKVISPVWEAQGHRFSSTPFTA